MTNNEPKSNHSLDGVKCAVNTCYYNADQCCTASEIMIQPHNTLSDKQETDCSTFILK
ncbi:MAG: DUF1540 domain-containing protein [Syntrophomonadaceae bacterium]|jgi:hypothetical protein|nr:DUF1540 domain-containing protein [Syntrophomonadaceae bacterium]